MPGNSPQHRDQIEQIRPHRRLAAGELESADAMHLDRRPDHICDFFKRQNLILRGAASAPHLPACNTHIENCTDQSR